MNTVAVSFHFIKAKNSIVGLKPRLTQLRTAGFYRGLLFLNSNWKGGVYMCQVSAQFTITKQGNVDAMQSSLLAMETVQDVKVAKDVLFVSFNHHKHTEDSIANIIKAHGFELKSVAQGHHG